MGRPHPAIERSGMRCRLEVRRGPQPVRMDFVRKVVNAAETIDGKIKSKQVLFPDMSRGEAPIQIFERKTVDILY